MFTKSFTFRIPATSHNRLVAVAQANNKINKHTSISVTPLDAWSPVFSRKTVVVSHIEINSNTLAAMDEMLLFLAKIV